eukprot:71318-Pyramimonas_sp.AAC.1
MAVNAFFCNACIATCLGYQRALACPAPGVAREANRVLLQALQEAGEAHCATPPPSTQKIAGDVLGGSRMRLPGV